MLKAGGAGAALGAIGAPWRGLDEDPSDDRRSRPDDEADDDDASEDPEINLANIQGNVLAGFNKDHQRLLFFRLGDGDRARSWLATMVDETATSEEVLAFNELFRRARTRRGGEGSTPQATWLTVAVTYPGLAALGVGAAELAMFPEAFREGMGHTHDRTGAVLDARAQMRSAGTRCRSRYSRSGRGRISSDACSTRTEVPLFCHTPSVMRSTESGPNKPFPRRS